MTWLVVWTSKVCVSNYIFMVVKKLKSAGSSAKRDWSHEGVTGFWCFKRGKAFAPLRIWWCPCWFWFAFVSKFSTRIKIWNWKHNASSFCRRSNSQPLISSIQWQCSKHTLLFHLNWLSVFPIPGGGVLFQMEPLAFRKMDFEEFCAAAISTHQLEAIERWEQIASTGFQHFEQEGNRVISVEELARVWIMAFRITFFSQDMSKSFEFFYVNFCVTCLAGLKSWPVGLFSPQRLDQKLGRKA